MRSVTPSISAFLAAICSRYVAVDSRFERTAAFCSANCATTFLEACSASISFTSAFSSDRAMDSVSCLYRSLAISFSMSSTDVNLSSARSERIADCERSSTSLAASRAS